MAHARSRKILLLSATLLTSACAAGDDSAPADQAAEDTIIHMLPLHHMANVSTSVATANAASACAQVTYFGGPLLTNVSVHPVFWNSTTKLQSNLNAFYSAIVGPSSAWWAVLSQYNIGFGSGVGGIIDTKSTANVTDAQVQTELNRLFTAGTLPSPNANTYYPVHFPSGMAITAPDGSKSCVQFCAYHGTYVRNGVNVNYGIIPDIGQSGCNAGCGGSTVTNNTDLIASHELVNATTDPAVGIVTVLGPPLGWYDAVDNAELGDLCNGLQGSSSGFTVQKVWSNAACACVDR